MNSSSKSTSEVSSNCRNAYVNVGSDDLIANTTLKKFDNIHYLAAKPPSRARSISFNQEKIDLLTISFSSSNLASSAP